MEGPLGFMSLHYMDYVDAQNAMGNTTDSVPEIEAVTKDTTNIDEWMNQYLDDHSNISAFSRHVQDPSTNEDRVFDSLSGFDDDSVASSRWLGSASTSIPSIEYIVVVQKAVGQRPPPFDLK